jgi:hypothetical protein
MNRAGSIADTLRSAAGYIARHGWYPGYLYDAHDRCMRRCAVHRTGLYPASVLGAIRAVLCGGPRWYLDTCPPEVTAAYAAAVDHLTDHLTSYGAAGMRETPLMWSAVPGRTPAQVVAALRAAASTAPAGPVVPALAPVLTLPTRSTAGPTGGGDATLHTLPTGRPAA